MTHPLHAPVLRWFDRHGRDLPWRAPDRTPWGVLVSEVMLQQTPVARVLPVWTAWMERWPTPADLAAAGTGEALRAWDRLGYPRRALRLQECARVIEHRHGGEVPAGATELLALPGVGRYTAAAVQAFAHGRRSVVLDTNVRRVLARAVGGRAFAGTAGPSAAEWRLAADLLPRDVARSVRWNAAAMELGALVCVARSPRCDACPVLDRCAWAAAGRPLEPTVRRRSQAWHGTDRQVRGRIMAALRSSEAPVSATDIAAAAAGPHVPDAAQLDRCLTGLIADGLVVRSAAGYRLPD